MSFLRTTVLLASLTALFMTIGYLIAGPSGLIIAFFIAAGLNLFSYWNSDKLVLQAYNAQEVTLQTAPVYYKIVSDLARKANLPQPRVYIVNNPQPNAFATGRNPQHSAVAATTGLLEILSPDELAGVMAHELSHIKHRDTLTMTMAATLGGAISMIANFFFLFSGNRDSHEQSGNIFTVIGNLLMIIIAPLVAMLIQMAISRTREYEADREGAHISGKPLALASALAKLSMTTKQITNAEAERHPETAHIFFMNPLTGKGRDSLFATHPDTGNRILALEEIAQASLASYQAQHSSPVSTKEVKKNFRNPWL